MRAAEMTSGERRRVERRGDRWRVTTSGEKWQWVESDDEWREEATSGNMRNDIMGCISGDTKAREVWMWSAGFGVCKIKEILREDCIQVSRKSLYHLVRKYQMTGSVTDLPRAPRGRKLSSEHFNYIDEIVENNRIITSQQLHVRTWHGG